MTEKRKRGRPKKKKTEDVPVMLEEMVKEVVKEEPPKPKVDLDRVPRLSHLPKVTLYACKIGIRGYKFFYTKPMYPVQWTKSMTGIQAESLLRSIKSGNRNNKLESLTLPK